MEQQRLYRHGSDRIIAGVCAGLGEYFDIDPTLVRIALILLAFAGGIGVMVYVILALLMPRQGDDSGPPVGQRARAGVDDLGESVVRMADRARSVLQDVTVSYKGMGRRAMGQALLGGVFLFVGAALLVSNFVDLWLLSWRWIGALTLLVVGLVLLFRSSEKNA